MDFIRTHACMIFWGKKSRGNQTYFKKSRGKKIPEGTNFFPNVLYVFVKRQLASNAKAPFGSHK
jgi:hypothetical protein